MMARQVPYEKIRETMRQDPEFVREWEALDEEFSMAEILIRARARAGMTQQQVADAMGVTQPAVAKIESGKGLTLRTLKRYAAAVGSSLRIELL